MSKQPFKFKSNVNIGNEVAEYDKDYLDNCFYEHSVYRQLSDENEKKCFLIGRTGSGKSAILKKIIREHDNVIVIDPENLSFNYITNDRRLISMIKLGIHLDQFFKMLWRHIIVVEIIKHKYKINNEGARNSFFDMFKVKFHRDIPKKKAIEYLEQYEGKFWDSTSERVKKITDSFERGLSAGVQILGGGEINANLIQKSDKYEEIKMEIQEYVSSTQITELNTLMKIINEQILTDEQNKLYILIDNLDKDWSSEELSNQLIHCLFQCVGDFVGEIDNLKFIVGLRTNIFNQLNYSSKKKAQGEKSKSLTMDLKWTETELLDMIDQRLKYMTQKLGYGGFAGLKELIQGKSRINKPIDYILERTQKRPRDLIRFINYCIVNSAGKSIIGMTSIREAEIRYSKDAIDSMIDEWKDPYLGIDKLIQVFRNKASELDAGDIIDVLSECEQVCKTNQDKFTWLSEIVGSERDLIGSVEQDKACERLVKLLFNIGFLGIKEHAKSPIIFSYDDRTIYRYFDLRQDYKCYIHKSFIRELNLSTKMRYGGESPTSILAF